MTAQLPEQCSKQRTKGLRNQVHQKHRTSHKINNNLCNQPTDKAGNRLTKQSTE